MNNLYEALLLDRQLCFPLYACAREMIKLYTPFLDELDLTYTQYIAMMVLWERKSVSVKELGEALYLDSGTLTDRALNIPGQMARCVNLAPEEMQELYRLLYKLLKQE